MKRKLLGYTGSEPVTVAEAKAHARIEIATDDTLIGNYISSARQYFETWCKLSLVEYQYELVYDTGELLPMQCLEEQNDILSIDEFNAFDTDDNATDMTAILPAVFSFSDNALFVTADGLALGTRLYGAFRLKYTVTPYIITGDIKHIINMLVAHFYENRESQLAQESDYKNLPQGVISLMQRYRIYTV